MNSEREYKATCFDIGTAGGCGQECPVYLRGDCPDPQEMLNRNSIDPELHKKLYADIKIESTEIELPPEGQKP